VFELLFTGFNHKKVEFLNASNNFLKYSFGRMADFQWWYVVVPLVAAAILSITVLLIIQYMRKKAAANKRRHEWNSAGQDVVVLHMFERSRTNINISPFPIKLETFLRMAKIKYIHKITTIVNY